MAINFPGSPSVNDTFASGGIIYTWDGTVWVSSSPAAFVQKSGDTMTGDLGVTTINSLQYPTAGALSNRNLIINGAMNVSQRGTSFSFAHDGTTTAYTIDRMSFLAANTESFDGTVTQSTDAPEGFTESWKLTTGTAEASIDADDLVYVQTALEGQDLQRLKYGLSSAQTVTISFYVKSSVTGTYGFTLYQGDAVRNRTATYTINTANTWEYKTITLTGDTAGTINDDNGPGLNIAWNLAAGSSWNTTDSTDWGAYVQARWAYGHAQNGVITTASATWQITGVQLEVGEKATPFEHRSYGDELARCQRYYQKSYNSGVTPGTVTDDGVVSGRIDVSSSGTQLPGTNFRYTMRANATVTLYSPATGTADRVSDRITTISTHNADRTVSSIYFPGMNGFGGFLVSASTGPAYSYHYTAEAEL